MKKREPSKLTQILVSIEGVILAAFLLPFLLVAHIFMGDGFMGFIDNLKRISTAPREWE